MFNFTKDKKFQEEVANCSDKDILLKKYINECIRDIRYIGAYDKKDFQIRKLVQNMALLTVFYNRVLDENYRETSYPTKEEMDLLINDVISECGSKKIRIRVNYYDSVFAGITVLADDIELMAIRQFEEDRINNEALISLEYAREEAKSRFVLFSNRHIIGRHGIYTSNNGCNFIRGIKDTKDESFTKFYPFTYDFYPYDSSQDVSSITVDRKNKIRTVSAQDGISTTQKFYGVYDVVVLGGTYKTDEELMDFIYTSRLRNNLESNKENDKTFVKK